MAHPVTRPRESDVFLHQIAQAVKQADPEGICAGVKTALEELAAEGATWIPRDYYEGTPDKYTRKLLHRCPENTYSIMLMVWHPGQGTAIHDHAGKWCVECVVRGEIEVISYHHREEGLAHRFTESNRIMAHTGDVGVLIPPNEYHLIRNVSGEPAATIHVYEGELLWCHTYQPTDVSGTFSRERCTLGYDD